MKKLIIIFLIAFSIVSCKKDKTPEDYFDYSLIVGQGYTGQLKEYKFFGMSSDYDYPWGEIHEHDPCSLTYVRTIPLDANTENIYDRYES